MRHTRAPGRVVLRDYRGRTEELVLAAGTTELRIPEAVDFTLLGGIPNHMHHMADDTKIGVFLTREECRRCRSRVR